MRITEAQLRRFIREAAADENTSQDLASVSQKIADPRTTEHEDLERETYRSDHLMRIGDQYYSDLIQKFPQIRSGLDQLSAAFEQAKTRRIAYLEKDFQKRLESLQKKLSDKTPTDVQQLKQKMLDRVKKTELLIGKYGDRIESNPPEKTYQAFNDPTSGWSLLLKEKGKSFAVAAFAPASIPCVISAPPDLSLNAAGKVAGTVTLPDISLIYEHEIIHQEDWAAEALAIGKEDFTPGAGRGRAAALASDLAKSAMLPKDQLTGAEIINRMRASPALSSQISLVTEVYFEPNDLKKLHASDVAAVIVVSGFARELDRRVDDYAILYYYIESLFPPGTNLGDPEPRSLFDLAQSPGAKDALDRSRDLAISTHVRITLSLMRPHLEAALASGGTTGAIIEATLRPLGDASDEEANRAAFILAVTDPKKLSDLTLVAAKEARPGPEETGTALAESTHKRWSQLAGLLKD